MNVKKILEIFKLIHEELNYFIYTSTDILKCFLCKLEGHLAKNCVNMESNPNSQTTKNNTNTDVNTTIPTENENLNTSKIYFSHSLTDNKRSRSQISSNCSQIDTELETNDNFTIVKNKSEKGKIEIPEETKQAETQYKKNDNTETDELDKKLISIKGVQAPLKFSL